MERSSGDLINVINELIKDNLSESILTEQLSEQVGLSKFHLHRVFSAQTGFELAEYMQRRKMERALALLSQGELSVIDVALAVGYESHSSFSRVFKQSFDVTPSQVLKGANCTPVVKHKKKRKSELEQVETTWLYLTERKVFGKFCRGFEQSSFAQVANETFGSLTEISSCTDYLSSEPLGVAMTNPWNDEPEQAEFFCGFLSGLEGAYDEQLDCFTWPEGHYICVNYTGPYHLMWQFISRLHSQWVEQKKITLATRQVIQRYLNHPATTSPEQLETVLYFPIEKVE